MNVHRISEAAPAKLNLHLHVLAQRSDGYHELDTSFALIDWCDQVEVFLRDDGQILRLEDQVGIDEDRDLSVRAARLMQAACLELGKPCPGVDLRVVKRIPQGAGLGGGSSDAASVIRLLNRLWALDLDTEHTESIALSLGADVPLFIRRQHALGAGVGEKLRALSLPVAYFVVVIPPISVSTAEVFADPKLTRASKALKIPDSPLWPDFFLGHNDLEAVVVKRYQAVAFALDRLRKQAIGLNIAPHWPRMSGSGSSVFCMVRNLAEGLQLEALVRADLAKLDDAVWQVKLVSSSLPALRMW